MTIDEFEPEDALLEISRKMSNVSIHKIPTHGGHVDKDAVKLIAMFAVDMKIYISCFSYQE